MKRSLSFFLPALLVLLSASALEARATRFEGSGEVVTVDPPYRRITIKHGVIKDFAGAEETEFAVASTDILKGLGRRDLVDFTVADEKGNVRIEKIAKTGVAPEEEGSKVGQVVQDVLVGTGEAAKTVTTPIAPAHDIMSGAVDATTGATGSVLENADTKVKTEF